MSEKPYVTNGKDSRISKSEESFQWLIILTCMTLHKVALDKVRCNPCADFTHDFTHDFTWSETHMRWLYLRWDSTHMRRLYPMWDSTHVRFNPCKESLCEVMSNKCDYSLLDISILSFLSFSMFNVTSHRLNLSSNKIMFCISCRKNLKHI